MRVKVDTTLFRKEYNKDFIILKKLYINDIIFSTINESWCKDFSKLMQGEFEMNMMRN